MNVDLIAFGTRFPEFVDFEIPIIEAIDLLYPTSHALGVYTLESADSSFTFHLLILKV
jgi:hypothetical protein